MSPTTPTTKFERVVKAGTFYESNGSINIVMNDEGDLNEDVPIMFCDGVSEAKESYHDPITNEAATSVHAAKSSIHDLEIEAHVTKVGDEQNQGACSKSPLFFVKKLLQWFIKLKKAFGSPFLIVILTVYGINQGIGGNLKTLATDYYWKDEQKLQPSSTQYYQAIAGIPWDIKPLYGLIADTFPVFGYQRWPYLAICGVASTLCLWFLGAIPKPTPWAATMLLSAVALCSAFPDVVTDATIAQHSRETPALASDLQSLSWGSMAFGGLIGSGISGLAVDSFGSRGSYLLLSVAPLLLLVAALALPETRLAKHLRKPKIGALLQTLSLFSKTLRNPAIWKPALYIYLSNVCILFKSGDDLSFV